MNSKVAKVAKIAISGKVRSNSSPCWLKKYQAPAAIATAVSSPSASMVMAPDRWSQCTTKIDAE